MLCCLRRDGGSQPVVLKKVKLDGRCQKLYPETSGRMSTSRYSLS